MHVHVSPFVSCTRKVADNLPEDLGFLGANCYYSQDKFNNYYQFTMSVQILKKLSPALKEVRIHLCPKTSTSNSTRQFVIQYYAGIKQKNPDLPVLVRECTAIEPKIWFRFEYGKEISVPLSNLTTDQIAELFKDKIDVSAK